MFRRPTPPTSATPKDAAASTDTAVQPQVQPFSAAELGEPPALAMPVRPEPRAEAVVPPAPALTRPDPIPAAARPVPAAPERAELRERPAVERAPETSVAKPAPAPSAAAPAAASPLAPSNMAPKMEMPPRRVVDIPGAPARRPEGGAMGGTFTTASGKELRTLVVGREISLAGEIGSCDALVGEGTVEAKLRDGSMIQITDSGLFKGSVEIEEADIGGRFEGELTVRGRLTVRATGRINGTVRYGELMVEAGGKLVGDIHYVGAEDGSDAMYNALRNSAE